MHLAETRDQAVADCTYGLPDYAHYFGAVGVLPLANSADGADGAIDPHEFVKAYAAEGNCCIGTPEDAIEYLDGLLDTSGGFGTFLMLGHDWASPEATFKSYELFARKVIPHFTGQLTAAQASHDWAQAKRGELLGRAGDAVAKAIGEHVAQKASH